MSDPARISHAHLSGKFSANHRVFAGYVAEHATLADLITTTECKGMADAVRKALGPHWQVVQDGQYLICARRTVFTIGARRSSSRLTTIYARALAWRDFYVMRRTLTHRLTGRQVLVTVSHTPSAVQSGAHWRVDNPRAVRAHRRGMTRWGQLLQRAHQAKPHRLRVAALDINVNLHMPVWRTYAETTLGLPSMWAHDRPDGGTHAGSRLIDTIHTDAPGLRGRLSPVAQPHLIDHHGVIASYLMHSDHPRKAH